MGAYENGRVYQPTRRDKQTDEQIASPIHWVQYSVRGKMYRESSRPSSSGRRLRSPFSAAQRPAPHGRYSRHCVQTLMTVEALMSSRAISHFASVSNGPNCVNATGPPGANS